MKTYRYRCTLCDYRLDQVMAAQGMTRHPSHDFSADEIADFKRYAATLTGRPAHVVADPKQRRARAA